MPKKRVHRVQRRLGGQISATRRRHCTLLGLYCWLASSVPPRLAFLAVMLYSTLPTPHLRSIFRSFSTVFSCLHSLQAAKPPPQATKNCRANASLSKCYTAWTCFVKVVSEKVSIHQKLKTTYYLG